MSEPVKCPTCGREIKSKRRKTVGGIMATLHLAAVGWAIALVHPIPLRAWFAFQIASFILVAIVKIAADS
ncbi:MAG: hypothetical protein ACRDNS_19145 [Trebonia sp.]